MASFFYFNKKLFVLIAIFISIIFIIHSNYLYGKFISSPFKLSSSIFINNKKSLKYIFKNKYNNSFSIDGHNNDNCFSAFENLNKINLTLYEINKKSNCIENDWILLRYKFDHVILVYNSDYLNKNNILIDYCEYSTVSWYKNDFSYKLNTSIKFINSTIIKGNLDVFIYVKCVIENSTIQYRSAYARILNTVYNLDENKTPINVFMLGFDSVSGNLWKDSLPKSTNYFINSLNATLLNRYNIVGDGTPAAVGVSFNF